MNQDKSNIQGALPLPKAYLIFTNITAITLIILFVFSGYKYWAFFSTVMLGAVVQTIFRTLKRFWKNSIICKNTDEIQEISNTAAIKSYMFIYIIMLFVTAFWYGVGIVIGELF